LLDEPQFIEIWRPTRHDERRGPKRHQRQGRRAPGKPLAKAAAGETPASPPDPAQSVAEPKADRPQHRGRQHRGQDRSSRTDRPDGPRHEAGKRDEKPRPRFREQRREWQDKAPDPNSPFAKLAALKAQLEANAKERR
jgi:ATP-dependent RNA helicase SUPV3L1/SUV3